VAFRVFLAAGLLLARALALALAVAFAPPAAVAEFVAVDMVATTQLRTEVIARLFEDAGGKQ